MSKRILIAPLDWGLGHVSRCIPIIKYFLARDTQVFLASSGEAGLLLQQEFPHLPYLSLPSYNIHYRSSLLTGIIRQIPAIIDTIHLENKVLEKLHQQFLFDIVLSDNRYGLWNKEIYSIFLTHQLNVRSPFLHTLTAKLTRSIHYSYIQHFNCCWIPDYPGENNLSGALSHGFKLPVNSFYVGPLSRISGSNNNHDRVTGYQSILVILSGPEPQRSFLEKIVISQASKVHCPIIIIKGKMSEEPSWKEEDNLRTISYLTTDLMIKEINKASVIVCRSGYSSIMDMALGGKKAIFISTPGQTEQEYLAHYHKKAGHYYSESQHLFDLERSLCKSLSYNELKFIHSDELLDAAYKNIIGEL